MNRVEGNLTYYVFYCFTSTVIVFSLQAYGHDRVVHVYHVSSATALSAPLQEVQVSPLSVDCNYNQQQDAVSLSLIKRER